MSEHSAFSRVAHRPWPVSARSWTWRQSWCDLLFAHWPVPASALRPLVPEPLQVEEFDGTSWVGVVPFRMEGVMRRPLPDLPCLSAFPELNVRLYVRAEGRPGVWFLSLDAANRCAVWAARRFFCLPYFHAQMKLSTSGTEIRYESSRSGSREVRFEAVYQPAGPPGESRPGSLEHWLTERYCLYAQCPRGRIHRMEVHHHPWPLRAAEADLIRNDLLRLQRIEVAGPPLLHFSDRLDVVVWPPEPVRH
jgi:uncharacterized protein YqjF (DUF2071 family)